MSSGPRRSDTICPIFGPFSAISDDRLPVTKDVLTLLLYQKSELKKILNRKNPPTAEAFFNVYNKIVTIWLKTAVPIISKERVMAQLKSLSDRYDQFKKYSKSKKKENFNIKLSKYIFECENTLFDLACCKCSSFNSCTCLNEKKVPFTERDFLLDQRKERLLCIEPLTKEKKSCFKCV